MKNEKNKHKQLVSFITAGFPNLKYTEKLALALAEGGSDFLEIGIPFSDPVADGPVIQEASRIAIEKGTTPKKALQIISRISKKTKSKIVILTYYNILYKFGVEDFAKEAKNAGVWGILAADLPVEEADELRNACRKNKIRTIFMIAPNTSKERLLKIAKATTGFLYLVARYGTTGTRKTVSTDAISALKKFKSIGKKKIFVGFGISKPEHARELARAGADGIIIGSVYVKALTKKGTLGEMTKTLSKMSMGFKTEI